MATVYADQEMDFGNLGNRYGIKNGYLYASSDTEVYRFKLNEMEFVEIAAQPEKIITGLIVPG